MYIDLCPRMIMIEFCRGVQNKLAKHKLCQKLTAGWGVLIRINRYHRYPQRGGQCLIQHVCRA
jgi:hypothetical protein